MSCGCQGKPHEGRYSLTLPDGTRTIHASEAEARAANRAAGGKGLVRRVQ